MRRGEGRASPRDSIFSAGEVKKISDLFGKNPFSLHSAAEPGVIQLPSANRSNSIKDFFLFIRKMSLQPRFEKGRHGVGEPKRNDPGKDRSRRNGRLNHIRNFM